MLRSLNPLWHLEGFHLRIAALAGIRDGDRVLDMGCGNGNGLSAMVSAAGPNGRVVAVDRDLPSLGRIAERFARDMDEQRLATSGSLFFIQGPVGLPDEHEAMSPRVGRSQTCAP
jgi:SAM-dependent methyltransferase